jgi:hypothetical protein
VGTLKVELVVASEVEPSALVGVACMLLATEAERRVRDSESRWS